MFLIIWQFEIDGAHAEEYLRLDQRCEALTKHETKIGEFTLD